MKHKIIYTDDYALIVSDEQAKENDWGYIPFQGGEVKLVHKFFASDWRKIIAHRPLTDAPILEGVPLLPEFSQGDDVEKEAKDYADNSATCDYEEGINVGKYQGFIEGYNKAKETYKYTEEDVIVLLNRTARKYFNEGREHKGNMAIAGDPLYGVRRELISMLKSLQQPKRPKYFECKMDTARIPYGDDGWKTIETGIKTITNLQGQIELVGTYEGGEQC